MKKVTVLAIICFLFVQCGYHLRGRGSFLPEHIKNIYIPMFENKTTRFQLDVKLTQSVIDELVARGKLEIVGNIQSADAVLNGEIVSFRATPVGFTAQTTADRYSITIVSKIVVRDLINKKVLYRNTYFPYQTEYEVPEGTDFETVESEAIDNIGQKFARSLIVNILEGF
ncbi:MAG: LPS assembly lipoprotein LptE [Elusimicrobiota bacterium]